MAAPRGKPVDSDYEKYSLGAMSTVLNWPCIKVAPAKISEGGVVYAHKGSMYGLLLESVQHFVIRLHGDDAWSAIVQHSGTSDLIFTTHTRYSNSTILKLAASCSHVIKDRTLEEYMCFFGQCFVVYCGQFGYDKIMRISGRYYRDFLHGIDNLHETIRFSYPKMVHPSFYVEQEDQYGCVLHYRSQRVGFTHYVIGQLTQFATAYYNVRVDIDVLKEEIHSKGCHVIYHLNFDNFASTHLSQSQVARSLDDFPSITLATFFKVFPFALVFDHDLCVMNAGQGLKVLFNSQPLVGKQVMESFALRRPLMDFTWENIICHQRVMFELEMVQAVAPARVPSTPCKAGQSPGSTMAPPVVLLKGQMRYIRDLNGITFLCTPLIGNLEDMEHHGLKLNDLSMYDSSRDMVLNGWQHASMLEYTIEKQIQKSQLIADNMRQLREWQKCSEQLLYAMIPQSIAIRLRNGEDSINTCQMFESVTIMFSYLVGFSDLCATLPALQCIKTINAFFCMFDKIVEEYGIFKVETLGDAVYMAAGGVPDPTTDHAHKVAAVALKLRDKVKRFKTPQDTSRKFSVRIGLHTGSVVAGVVGKRTPQYCLFGDSVNTASRMQTYGEPGQIHISESCQDGLKGTDFITVFRGTMDIKGKGVMRTFWLVGVHGDNMTNNTSPIPDNNEYTEYYQTDDLPVMPTFLPGSPNAARIGWPGSGAFSPPGGQGFIMAGQTTVMCKPALQEEGQPWNDTSPDDINQDSQLQGQDAIDHVLGVETDPSSSDDDLIPKERMRRRTKSFTGIGKISVEDFRDFLQRKMASKLTKALTTPCPFSVGFPEYLQQDKTSRRRRASWHPGSHLDSFVIRADYQHLVLPKCGQGLHARNNLTAWDREDSREAKGGKQHQEEKISKKASPSEKHVVFIDKKVDKNKIEKQSTLTASRSPGLKKPVDISFLTSPLPFCPVINPTTSPHQQRPVNLNISQNRWKTDLKNAAVNPCCPSIKSDDFEHGSLQTSHNTMSCTPNEISDPKYTNESCRPKMYLNGSTKCCDAASNNGQELGNFNSHEDIFSMDDIHGTSLGDKQRLTNGISSGSNHTTRQKQDIVPCHL